MPLLSFEVKADYQEAMRLRQEIDRLESKLKSFGPGTSIQTIRSVESQLQSARKQFNALTNAAMTAGAEIEMNIRKGVNGAMAAVNELQDKLSEPIGGLTQALGIAGLGAFLNQVKNIRSEFQQMESSINVLVGEKKGQSLMSQLTDFAKVSPLDFKGTVGGAQMMLGFGIDADKVPRYLAAIGDVAMGDAQRFQSLTLAFSQMSATGKLMGQDLNQMINAGFNPLQTMAESTGKSIAALKKEMSDGKITAEMVQQAFVDATSEGGKFYNMSAKASETLGGQMSMLQDATDLAFNDLGKGLDGFLIKAIQGATYLVENWKTLGRVLTAAIATFGVYKASIMAVEFAEKKSAEEKTEAVIAGYNKQLLAMQQYEDAKKAEQSLSNSKTAIDIKQPDAIKKLSDGKALSDKELKDVEDYTAQLAALQAEKEKRDGVTSAIDNELNKLRELNSEKEASATKTPLDSDLQKALDSGIASEDEVNALQEQRKLLEEKAKLAASNLALAEEENQKAIAGKSAAEEQVAIATRRKQEADELVARLQEEHELLQADDELHAPLDEYGQVIESLDTLSKAEELESAQKEAAARASELLTAQNDLETAGERANTAEKELNAAQTEADTAAANNNTAATLRNTTTEATNTATIKANTAGEIANTASTKANTVSTTQNSLASKVAIGWSKMKTTAHHLETAAINGVKRATDALKLAWATNPLGIILTAGTAIISTLWSIFGAMDDAKEKSEQFGEEAKKTTDEVNLLFSVLESTSEKSKVHKDALDKLVGITKEYGIAISDEKDKMQQLIENKKKLIELIIEEGRQRQIANNLADLQDSTKEATEDFEKIAETMITGDHAKDWRDMGAKIIAEDVDRNAEELEKLKQTIESYVDAKNQAFEKFTDEDQKTLDAAIAKYDELAYGRANKLAEKYGSDKLTIRISDFSGTVDKTDMMFINNYTAAITERNEKIKEYIKLQSESEAVTEANKAKPEPYSAAGKGYDDLIKDIEDANTEIKSTTEELEKLGGTETKVNVDSTDADNAKTSVDDATAAVETHTNTEGTTNIDSTQAETATDKVNEATNAVETLDGVSAEPVIRTTWVDNFISKISQAWNALMKLLGVEGEDMPTPPTPPTPAKPAKSANSQKADATQKRNEAQNKRNEAKAELLRKAKEANTDKEFAEAKSALNKAKATVKRDSAEYKEYVKALEELDKRDKKTSGTKKGKGNDDPKQREYERRKAELEEKKRTAELVQAEENRQRELALSMEKDSSDKEIRQLQFEADKKLQTLLSAREKEAEKLKEYDRQQWLKGGKNRKAYQWKQTKTDDEYLAEAGTNIGYDTQKEEILFNRDSGIKKVQKEMADAMLAYLKEYGTFQQKRYAIEQDYADKIQNAKNDGERLQYEAQRKSELSKLDIDAIKQQVDWGSLFGDFGTMLADQVQPTIDKLQAITKTDDFRNSTFEEQKAVYELISTLKGSITKWDNDIFSTLGNAVSSYQSAMIDNTNAIEAESKARETAEAAQNKLRQIEEQNQQARAKGEEVNQAAEDEASQAATAAENALASAAEHTKNTTTTLANAQQTLTDATKNATEQFAQLASGIQGLASGSLSGVWKGFTQLSKLFTGNDNLNNKIGKGVLEGIQKLFGSDSKVGKAVGDALSVLGGNLFGSIIEAVFSILDILKDGIGNFVAGLIDTVLQAVNGLLKSVFKGEIVTAIGESLITNISSILDTISFGGFSSLMNTLGLSGDSDKDLEDDVERLSNTNEALRKAVEELTEVMEDAAVADATDLYQQQKSNIEQAMANTQEMMSRSAAAYSNGTFGIGGKHSSNKKINDAMSSNEWKRISDILKKSVNSASDFWNLTSEQMAKIAKDAPDLYAKIKQYADDGYKDAAQYMDEYIEYYKELEELEDAYREKLTDVSFDSVKDEFKSMLLDMESDTEDFADNFESMMQQAVINSLMSSKYNDMIEAWYKEFANAMGDDGKLSPSEQAKLKKQWDDIVDMAVTERDSIKKAMGWDGSTTQQSSSSTLQSMSQDTGDAIEGRLTALQIAVEAIRSNHQEQTLSIADLNDDLLSIIQTYNQFNVHYDNIERQMAKMYVELQTISENTGAIVKPIQNMETSLNRIESKVKYL